MKPTMTDDTLKLLLFLQKYPNEWHAYSKDWLTVSIVKKCKKYYNVEIDKDQMKLNTGVTQ